MYNQEGFGGGGPAKSLRRREGKSFMRGNGNQGYQAQAEYIARMQDYTSAFAREKGRAPRCFVRTYGCQQNAADSEKLLGLLCQMGYAPIGEQHDADLILFNTCAVREHAEDRVFGNVGALKGVKKRNPELVIGLCGCMMQQESAAQKIRDSFPYVDLVFGTHALHRLPEFLWKKVSGKKRVFDLTGEGEELVEGIPLRREGSLKAGLPILYGCNNFCSYCIVPYVRGRERSRDPQVILEEARGLVEHGVKEIMLLGQNVNSYAGAGGVDFAELLRQVNGLPGDFRIRFMSSHPKDMTERVIDTIAQCSKVCNHIHLPVQSGNDRVLAAMNRKYDTARYRELIAYARKRIPDVVFTSDLIVGFPGETYEEFLDTLALIKEVRYSALFTFIYSRRSGTKAAELPDPVPYEEKSAWLRELLAAQEEISMGINTALIGSTCTVLVEEKSEKPGRLLGRNEGNIITEFAGEEPLIGQFVRVKVTAAHNWAVEGELA